MSFPFVNLRKIYYLFELTQDNSCTFEFNANGFVIKYQN